MINGNIGKAKWYLMCKYTKYSKQIKNYTPRRMEFICTVGNIIMTNILYNRIV